MSRRLLCDQELHGPGRSRIRNQMFSLHRLFRVSPADRGSVFCLHRLCLHEQNHTGTSTGPDGRFFCLPLDRTRCCVFIVACGRPNPGSGLHLEDLQDRGLREAPPPEHQLTCAEGPAPSQGPASLTRTTNNEAPFSSDCCSYLLWPRPPRAQVWL